MTGDCPGYSWVNSHMRENPHSGIACRISNKIVQEQFLREKKI